MDNRNTWTQADQVKFGQLFAQATEEDLKVIQHCSSLLPMIQLAEKELERRAALDREEKPAPQKGCRCSGGVWMCPVHSF